MAYEMKDNSGSLFKNDKREKDSHPHATGKCLIDGKLYYVSAWTKEGAKGRFQSLSFKPAEDGKSPQKIQPQKAHSASVENDLNDDLDSDLPF